MMVSRRVRVLALCCPLLCAAADPSPAANTSGFVLREATESVNPVEPTLDKWYREVGEAESPQSLSAERYAAYFAQRSPWEQALMQLRYPKRVPEAEKGNAAALAVKLLEVKERPPAEPVLAYVIDELLSHPEVNKEQRQGLGQMLRQLADQSCPQRSLLMRDLDEYRRLRDLSEEHELLRRISRFRAEKFQESALEAFIGIIPDGHRSGLKADLLPLVNKYPQILEDNAWLSSTSAKEVAGKSRGEPELSFEKASREARVGHCSTARTLLLQGLNRSPAGSIPQAFEPTAKKIEACFKPKGPGARLRFWASCEETLSKHSGFVGLEIALHNRAMVLWGEDRFAEARTTVRNLLQQARDKGLPTIVARALYTLARIDENEGKTSAAIQSFQTFTAAFPEHEHIDAALMSLILLKILNRDLNGAKESATLLMNKYNTGIVEEPNASSLSFALFWGGRVAFALGDRAGAEALWRRVAADYYSSFYGAVAHFLVEKLTRKSLVLEPKVSRPFQEAELYQSLDLAARAAVMRIKSLLAVGLTEAAQCEIDELGPDQGDPHKAVVKAMYLYATGDWLEGIRRYGNVSRQIRNTLPLGMERLLFPRAFTESVLLYSDKLGMDPDYIMSIIRQESVFNPKARSTVGATGLMQLMPRTALVEARSLGKSYASSERKQQLSQEVSLKGRLFDADINLALGVHHVHRLMARYRDPVLVLAAYNANPKAADRWLAKLSTDDPLLFIENIPYRETRAYVKLVLRNYFYYKRWYGAPGKPMPHFDSLATKIGISSVDTELFSPELNISR